MPKNTGNNGSREVADNIEEQINAGQKWEDLSAGEKRWSDFDRFMNEAKGKNAGVPGLSPEDQAEFKRITSDDYISDGNQSEIQASRIMGRILSGKGTAQDFKNLYASVAYLSSKFEIMKTDEKFVDPVYQFAQKYMSGTVSLPTNFTNVTEENLSKCKLKFDGDGHVVLTDAQKTELFNIKKTFEANLKDEDKAILSEGWNVLKGQAANKENQIVIRPNYKNPHSIDREDYVTELTKGFLKKHPEFRAPEGENLAESRMDEQKKALFTDMKNAGESITTLKESWKAMESHTAFSFMNSSEFKKMDKAFNDYIKAYDNLMAGRTIDGKGQRPDADSIEPADAAKLKELQTKMQEAAKGYAAAKRAQKGGGIDQHSTKQGKDRLAMAGALANFDLISKETAKEASQQFQITKGKAVKVVTLSDLQGKDRGHVNLQHNARKLQRAEQKQKGNDGMIM